MKSYGHIDMNNNEIQQAVIQDETATGFPPNPTPGRILFKDARFYMCVYIDGDLPVWAPMTSTLDTAVHVQSTPASVWTVTHNLRTTTPLIQVFDASGATLIPDSIVPASDMSSTITFTSAIDGRAVAMYGDIMGSSKPVISYTHTQETASTTWVINHNLGYQPIIRVFVGNEEVQPLSIIHNDLNTTTITFTNAHLGIARAI